MKKSLILCLCILLSLSMMLTACNTTSGNDPSTSDSSTPVASSDQPSSDGPSGDMDVIGGDSENTYQRKTDPDSFVYGAPEEPTTLVPADNKFVSGSIITCSVYDQLIKLDKDGNFENVLATSVEYTDDTTLVIKIRDGIKFSNGNPLTSDDVLFTFERLAASSVYAPQFACVDFENTKIIDETTLEVKLNQVFAPLLAYVALPNAAVLSRAYFNEVGEDVFSRNPVGTGAFTFDEWIAGDHVTLTRNDSYWGDKPEYKTLVVRFILEPTTRFIEFETGAVDAIGDLSGTDIDRMKAGGVDNAVLYTVLGQNVMVFEMYQGYEPLADINVRKAIAHAIDYEALVEASWGSSGVVADSMYAPDTKYYNPIGIYEYDPDLSRSLLEEAGYGDGLTLQTYTYAGVEAEAMEIMQDMLAKVGITLNIELTDLSTMIGTQVTGTSQVGFSNGTIVNRDPDKAISSRKMSSDYMIAVIREQELQDLFDAGVATLDEAKRAEIYQKAAQFIYDHYLSIPIRFQVVAFAARDYVDNFPVTASNYFEPKYITFK